MDKELAELVGIFLGDGSISILQNKKYSTFYCAKITLDSRELQYQQHVAVLIERVLHIKPLLRKLRDQNTLDVVTYRKSVVEHLRIIGLELSPKWNRAKVPEQFMNPELGKYVLRGYFDTDGCVVVTNNNGTRYPRLEMKISPSPMQQQLISLLQLYGFRFGIYRIGRGKVRIQLNGLKQLRLWSKIVGFSNEKHQTKAESFLDVVTFKSDSRSRSSQAEVA